MAVTLSRHSARLLLALVPIVLFNASNACKSPVPQAVTTYHYDNLRTGWNPNEIKLDYARRKIYTNPL